MIILVFCMLILMSLRRHKLFKDQYVLKFERSLGILQIMLCAFLMLLNFAVLVRTFPIFLLIMGVLSLKHIFQGMKALMQDLRALRRDFSLVVPKICLSKLLNKNFRVIQRIYFLIFGLLLLGFLLHLYINIK
jgi:diacylglycerol kinase